MAEATGTPVQAWSELRTSGKSPDARGGHTATLVEKNLLVMGGQQHRGGGKFEYFSLDPHVLNTETLAWFCPRLTLGKGPEPRSYHTTTRVGSVLYVFGGQAEKRGGSSGILGDMPVFDLVRMSWEARDTRGKQPRARYWHSAALVEGKLFIFGGFSGSQSLNDVSVLDTEAQLWSQPMPYGSVPPALSNCSCTVVGGSRLYVFGGMTIAPSETGESFIKYSNDVYVLDSESMTWERLRRRGTQPVARAYHESVLVGGYVLVLGGWSGAAQSLGELSTLDLNGLGSWYSVQCPGQSPPGVYGHSATLIGSKVVLFGGWDGVSPLASVHVLDTTQL